MQSLITNERGISLVEVIASTVLLSIIIIAFLTIFPQMKISNENTGGNLDAANIAKELLSNLKEYSYEDIKKNNQIGEFKYSKKGDNVDLLILEGQYKTIEREKVNVRVTIQISPAASNITLREMYIEILNQNENEKARIHGYLLK